MAGALVVQLGLHGSKPPRTKMISGGEKKRRKGRKVPSLSRKSKKRSFEVWHCISGPVLSVSWGRTVVRHHLSWALLVKKASQARQAD